MWIRLGFVILTIIVAVILARSKKIKYVFTVMAAIIIAIYIALIVTGGIHQWQKERKIEPSQQIVNTFIQEMNPELNHKITKIQEEITLANTKTQQLYALKEDFPNQAQMIEEKINQWKILKAQLIQVSEDIDQRVEKAYVVYKIDEIQGKNKFSIISKELLKEANAVLVNAELTKSTLEAQLYE